MGDPVTRKCSQCGTTGLEPGFVDDQGQASQGYLRWIAGPLERGLLGGARRMGRSKYPISAYRCPNCAHLELYVEG